MREHNRKCYQGEPLSIRNWMIRRSQNNGRRDKILQIPRNNSVAGTILSNLCSINYFILHKDLMR